MHCTTVEFELVPNETGVAFEKISNPVTVFLAQVCGETVDTVAFLMESDGLKLVTSDGDIILVNN